MRSSPRYLLILLVALPLGCPDGEPEPDDDLVADDDASADDDSTDGDDDVSPSDDDSQTDDDTTPTDDLDGDGWTVDQGDCDDHDPSIHPGAEEVLCDSLDNDCDGYGVLSGAVVDSVEYATVPMAVDAASDGGTVYVCPGVHTDQIHVNDDRALTISSYTGNRDDTILDGGGLQTVIYVDHENTLTLSHLTIRNGRAQPWISGAPAGGGLMSLAASTRVEDCAFVDNVVADPGGMGAGICVRRWTFSDPVDVEVVIEGCHFENNRAEADGGVGGALAVGALYVDYLVTLSASSFVDNHSDGSGGAIWINGDHLPEGPHSAGLSVDACSFEDNTSGYGGGGIHLDDFRSLEVVDCSFAGNAADLGGALHASSARVEATPIQISDSDFSENRADVSGGAVAIDVSDSDESVELCLDTLVFSGNSTSIETGGAVRVYGEGSGSFESTDVVYEGNAAGSSGGGLHAILDQGMTFSMTGGAFSGNQAYDQGGAAHFYSDSEPVLVGMDGVLVEGNLHTNGDWAVLVFAANVVSTLTDCVVESNAGGGAGISGAGSGARLLSIDTDWGEYPNDNSPWDVIIGGDPTYAAFGASESFTCTGETGCI